MEPETLNIQLVLQRIDKLERQNRRLKQLGAAALLVLSALILTAQTTTHRTVEANAFFLTDSNGKRKAELSMTGGVPGLCIYGNGKASALLAANEDGPFLLLVGSEGDKGRMSFAFPDALTVQDKQGFKSVLGVTKTVTSSTGENHQTSAAALTLFDKEGNVIWQAPRP